MRVEKKVHCKKVYLFYSVAGGEWGGGDRQTTAKNVWPSSPILAAWERVKIIRMILEMAVLSGMWLMIAGR